jgi:hypothetical protein
MMFGTSHIGIVGDDGFHLDTQESLGDNGDGCRLLVFARNGCKGFVLLAYYSIEAFSLSKIFGWVSPDV